MYELDLRLDKKSISALEEISSSACLLLASSLMRRTNSSFKFSASLLAKHSSADALYGDGWLFSYEGGRRLWLDKPTASYISSDKFFGPINSNGVSFFDETARLPPLLAMKVNAGFDSELFDSDDDLKEYFDFDESDEEYFDTDGEDDEDDEEDEEDEEDGT